MLPYIDEAEVTITSSDPSVVSRSRSGRKVSRNLEQQKWLLDVTWPAYLDDKSLPLEIALDEMKGQSESVGLVHPVRSYHPSASGVWQVIEPASAGANQVLLNGAGSLSLGHLVRFFGHTKAYRITKITGDIVQLFPPLRRGVSQSEVVQTHAVAIDVTRTEDDVPYKTKGPLTTVSASFEEVL